MHDGSVVRFRSVPENYDPGDRSAVEATLRNHQQRGEVATGLLYLDESVPDLHEMSNTVETPMVDLAYERLCPGAAALDSLQDEYR